MLSIAAIASTNLRERDYLFGSSGKPWGYCAGSSMTPYLLLYLNVSLFLLLSQLYREHSRWLLLMAVWQLILFSGLRDNVGIDFQNYVYYFKVIASGQNTYMEKGYSLLVWTIAQMGGNYQLHFLIVAALTTLLVYFFIIRHSNIPALSLFLYVTFAIFYLSSFNIIRQFIAIGFFAYSLRYVVERSFPKYLITILIGSLFHVTIVALLPMYFLLNINYKLRHYLMICMLYAIWLIFLKTIFLFLGKSVMYFTVALQTEQRSGVSSLAYAFIILSAILIWKRHAIQALNPELKLFTNMLFYGTLIGVTPLFVPLPADFIMRMTTYFTISLIIIIPALSNFFIAQELKALYLFGVFGMGSAYFLLTLHSNGGRYMLIPYTASLHLFGY